jgi:hypothetical protein
MKNFSAVIAVFMVSLFILKGQSKSNFSETTALRNDWMKGKYGIMVHWLPPDFLHEKQKNQSPQPARGNPIEDLNRAVDAFDIERFLKDFDKTGAEWLIYTIGQNSGTYSSPNSVIDSFAGLGHTSRRDLVLEIARAIKQRGKKFIAYLPCEINGNKSLHEGFCWNTRPGTNQEKFQERYLLAIREWSERFGENLDGWWFDGCYTWEAFHSKYMKWEKWYEAGRAGNKNAVLTFNSGVIMDKNVKPIVPEHDYLAGEVVVLIDGKIRLGIKDNNNLFMPETAYVKNTKCLYHVLVPIDAFWGHGSNGGVFPEWATVPFQQKKPIRQDEMEPPLYTDNDLIKFVKDFTGVGGAVTLNVGIFQEGYLGKESVKQLQNLNKTFKKLNRQ